MEIKQRHKVSQKCSPQTFREHIAKVGHRENVAQGAENENPGALAGATGANLENFLYIESYRHCGQRASLSCHAAGGARHG